MATMSMLTWILKRIKLTWLKIYLYLNLVYSCCIISVNISFFSLSCPLQNCKFISSRGRLDFRPDYTEIHRYRDTDLHRYRDTELGIINYIISYRVTEIKIYRDTEIQRYSYTEIQRCRAQRYRDTEIHRYRDTMIQRYRDTEVGIINYITSCIQRCLRHQ